MRAGTLSVYTDGRTVFVWVFWSGDLHPRVVPILSRDVSKWYMRSMHSTYKRTFCGNKGQQPTEILHACSMYESWRVCDQPVGL